MLPSAPTGATSSAAGITPTTSEIILHPDLSLPRDSQNTFLHTFQVPFLGPPPFPDTASPLEKTVPGTCEKIGFTDFSTTHFQCFTQLKTGPNSIFSHVPDTVSPDTVSPRVFSSMYMDLASCEGSLTTLCQFSE